MNPLHDELAARLVGNRAQSEASQNGFSRCGRRVPEVRAILKTDPIKALRSLPGKQVLDTWHDIYMGTPHYEVGSLAIYYYQYQALSRVEFNTLRQWIDRCDCWEHSDDLSKIFADTLERNPNWVLPTLKKWNRAKNPWQRRQSVVSLLEYTQKRQRVLPFEQLIEFVITLLDDDEYYVQKGIGWTLREIYNAHPKQMLEFFEQRYRDIAPLAWSAATEKLDKSTKTRLNQQRKQARAK